MSLARRLASVDARVAAWSILALLATAAVDPILADEAGDARVSGAATGAPMHAKVEANVATLALPEPIEVLGLDPAAIALVVGQGPPTMPASIEGADAGSRLVRLTFREGAASEDTARLVLPDGRELVAEVATLPGLLPSPRFAARAAGPDTVAYVVGGATTRSVASFEWSPLDAILRVDLASGRIATMDARLPGARYGAAPVWDPRPTDACPEGCLYAFGGTGPDGAALDEIVRFDPAGGRVETLGARLPVAASGLVAFFDGSRAHMLGGAQPGIFRFDPKTGEVELVGASPLASLEGLGGTFDPRPSADCPEGCGYLFGGGVPVTRFAAPIGFDTPLDQTRDTVLRYDASSGSLVALAALMPEPRGSPGVAWDGSRAIIAGGGGCVAALVCQYPASVLAFDPATSRFEALETTLDPTMRETTLVWREGEAIVLAGVVGTASASEPLDRILRLRLR